MGLEPLSMSSATRRGAVALVVVACVACASSHDKQSGVSSGGSGPLAAGGVSASGGEGDAETAGADAAGAVGTGGSAADGGGNSSGNGSGGRGGTDSGGGRGGGSGAAGHGASGGTAGASRGGAGAGGQAGTSGRAGTGGMGGMSYAASCAFTPSAAKFKVPGAPGILRVMYWNDSWLLATSSQVGTFALDGTPIVPFTDFFDAATETSYEPFFAATDAGLLITYGGRPLDTSIDPRSRVVLLDEGLAVKAGPFDVGPTIAAPAGLAPDGTAISWYQGYGSSVEGYRFSLFDPPMDLVGAPDELNTEFESTYTAEITRRQAGYLVFFRNNCTSVQAFDDHGARVGTTTVLKLPDRDCPDDTNLYASRASVHAVSANGVHFVGFGSWGTDRYLPWTGYALVDDQTAEVRALKALPYISAADYSDQPTVAAFGDRFGIAWSTSLTFANSNQLDSFALIGPDGTQLSPVTKISDSSAKFITGHLAASPSGFVLFTVLPEDEKTSTYTAIDISCTE